MFFFHVTDADVRVKFVKITSLFNLNSPLPSPLPHAPLPTSCQLPNVVVPVAEEVPAAIPPADTAP